MFLTYDFFILFLRKKFITYTSSIDKIEALPFVSIIIIGRNEANNIQKCLQSIHDNSYPKNKYEIIYIDDHSDDNSIEILSNIDFNNFKFLELKDYINNENINNFKKEAIRIAIDNSKSDFIIQSDADVIVPTDWIYFHSVNLLSSEKTFNTGPVFYSFSKGILGNFQYYDLITTMGVTCAGIASEKFFLANGANMSFTKQIYYDINSESTTLASGDDVFFIQECKNNSEIKINFIKHKNAYVITQAETTIGNFIKQRVRWGTKTVFYKDKWLKSMILLVFMSNSLLIIDFILSINIFSALFLFFFFLILKLIIDIFFIKSIIKFYNLKSNLISIIISLILYPFYITIIGIMSLFHKEYEWKGRRVK
ncbi:MAG: glycosyltransferase [Saprospiraceae bacterium]